MKKLLLGALAVAMALCMVSCGGKKKADATGPLEISIFTIQQRQQPPADNKVYKWMKEKFDVSFKFDILVGDKEQKKGLLISDPSSLPDLVEIDDSRFIDAGVLWPIGDWISQTNDYPNLKKHYMGNGTDWLKMQEADDPVNEKTVYCLPNYGVYDGADQGTFYNGNAFWIQKEVLKEFGYPKIQYIDEYFDILEKYAKKYPTIDGMPTIPFYVVTASWEIFNLYNPPVFLAGSANEGEYIIVKDSSTASGYKIELASGGPSGKRWYKIANEMWNKGLIDPESFTDTQDQYKSKIASGRMLGMFIQGWEFQGDAEATLKANGKANRSYAPLPIVFDSSVTPHYRDRSLPNVQRGYGITTNCSEAKAKRILKFMDDMLTEENQIILQWGFEGEDWQKDSNGRPYRTTKQREEQNDPTWQLSNKATLWQEEAPKMEGSFPSSGYACNMDNLPWEYQAKLEDHPEDLELFNAYGVASYAALVDPDPRENDGWYPMWQLKVPADGTEEALIYAKLTGVYDKYLPGLIMCKPSEYEAKWAEFTKELQNINLDVYEKWFQEKLDNRVKKFGGSKAR